MSRKIERERTTGEGAGFSPTEKKNRMMKKKRKAASAPTPLAALPWRAVPVDSSLTGDSEGGFAGLEELPGCEARALLAGLAGGGGAAAAAHTFVRAAGGSPPV